MNKSNDDSPNQQYVDELREIFRDGTHLLERLNRLSIEEIQRAKSETDAVDMARVYYHLRLTLEHFKDKFKGGIGKTFNRLAVSDFPDILEDIGLANVPLSDVGKVIAPSTRTYCRMHAKDACIRYLESYEEKDPETGEVFRPYKDLPTYTVNANTLASTAKDLAKQGKQFPEFITDEKGEKVLDPNGVPIPMFETGHLNNTTWRALPKKKS